MTLNQLTGINLAKILTVLLLLGYALIYGISDLRQVIYLSLHISYCLWWLVEQWFFPPRSEQIFQEKITIVELILILLVVGVFYSLPGYLAFRNPLGISYLSVAIALPVYIFGSLINAVADTQKLIAKEMGAGLVKDNIWRFSRNINYFGDLGRYLSFCIISGSWWSYILPLSIAILYYQRIKQKEATMTEKYPDYPEYQEKSANLIPYIW
ncbi:MAG: DUF1295 domain-containing protein [Gloeocapsa sp. DLM2.Bin57]|nr:MAG: DUF1295 domain-containing protein [Gloeocapsa sp. DLM2.Bin57]